MNVRKRIAVMAAVASIAAVIPSSALALTGFGPRDGQGYTAYVDASDPPACEGGGDVYGQSDIDADNHNVNDTQYLQKWSGSAWVTVTSGASTGWVFSANFTIQGVGSIWPVGSGTFRVKANGNLAINGTYYQATDYGPSRTC